jgi:hypothetical protein
MAAIAHDALLRGETHLDDLETKEGRLVVTTHRVRMGVQGEAGCLASLVSPSQLVCSVPISEVVRTSVTRPRLLTETGLNVITTFCLLFGIGYGYISDGGFPLSGHFALSFALAFIICFVGSAVCAGLIGIGNSDEIKFAITLRSQTTPLTGTAKNIDDALRFIDNVEVARHEWEKRAIENETSEEHARRAVRARRSRSPAGARYPSVGWDN